jgi:hypothetical protein
MNIIRQPEKSRRKSRLCPIGISLDRRIERSTSRCCLVRTRLIHFHLDFRSIAKKAEIGFTYDETSGGGGTATNTPASVPAKKSTTTTGDDSADDDIDDDDEDEDLDIEIDISQLTSETKASLNNVATNYGMAFGDFAQMLILDREEMQTIRENKLEREQDMPVKVRSAVLRTVH